MMKVRFNEEHPIYLILIGWIFLGNYRIFVYAIELGLNLYGLKYKTKMIRTLLKNDINNKDKYIN